MTPLEQYQAQIKEFSESLLEEQKQIPLLSGDRFRLAKECLKLLAIIDVMRKALKEISDNDGSLKPTWQSEYAIEELDEADKIARGEE